MYFHEPTYDLDILCRQNLHIHSTFSGCAKREMLLHDIVRTAELNGLETIAITDHVSPFEEDEEKFRQSLISLRETAKTIESPVKLLIGAELSAYVPVLSGRELRGLRAGARRLPAGDRPPHGGRQRLRRQLLRYQPLPQ